MNQKFAIGAALLIAACSDDAMPPAPPPPPQNSAPIFSSPSSVSVEENSSGAIYTASADDPDGDTITFTISGGADAGRFSLTGDALAFAAPPDFDMPGDADGDNIYQVQLTAADGAASTALDLSVTVTDAAGGFSVVRVASGLSQPLYVLGRGDGSNRIFILEKTGQVEVLNLDNSLLAATPFIDVSGSISTSGEGGLLGMALAPDFATSGEFYLHVNNLSGDTEIRRYSVSAGNPEIADPASLELILSAAQPADNHNGGWIDFGPDGFLYIALGDGGGANDPFSNGQDPDTLLGAILRIDPSSDDFPSDADRNYAIPAGNPFTSGGGAPEVYAYGLRNPFRASFDRTTGDLYIGDVGQGAIEEIDLIQPGEAGLNFGWPILEGTRVNAGGSTTGLTPPVAEYQHGLGPLEGRSVTGGYVYRGAIEDLQGDYVFGDFVSDNVWRVDVAQLNQGTTLGSAGFTNANAAFAPDLGAIDSISSFGENDAGDLFVVGIDGEVFQVVPE